MYFLVYIVPATGGSGFGVFCAVLLAIGMLLGAAFCSYSWLAAPAALAMALLESGSLWWILPVAIAVCIAINLVSAKVMENRWFPLLTAGILVTLSTLVVVGVTIWQAASGITAKWYEWLLLPLGLVIGVAWLTLMFYSYLNTCIALTSPVTLWMGLKPCLGALCAFVGMFGIAMCIQGLCEGVVSWFSNGGDGSVLDGIRAQIHPDMLDFITLGLVSEEKNVHILRRMENVVDFFAQIPAWWRFFLGLALTIGCGVGEHICSDGYIDEHF